MKTRILLFLLTALFLMCGAKGFVLPAHAEPVDDLRRQLKDVQYKEAEVKIRLEQLDFDMKPENIERFFTGYGSTRPEELRESRRRQLQLEKDHLNSQLQQLASDRMRLENEIMNAQLVTPQSPGAVAVLQPNANRHLWLSNNLRTMLALCGLVLLLGSLVLRVLIRRRRHVEGLPNTDITQSL